MAPATSFRDVQRAAISAASSAAAATGQGVAVDGMTTPTEQTLAMPDGTMVYEATTVPVRVERNGEWVAIDTTLVRVGDWVEPVASAAPVRFSPGGTDELAQVQTETGEWITERWPYGTLPAPIIDGDTATYPDVLPDVDLKMVATKTGQASIYVVKTEKAARSAKLEDLHVIIEDADLTTTPNGTVEAELADGSQVVAGQPLWWDSSDGGTYREPGGIEPILPVAHDVGDDHVALDVGASVAAEERRDGDDVTYPIFVDPDWAAGSVQSWYTDAAFPNQSYLNASASDVLRMGRWSTNRGNAFFEFPLSALNGKEIVAAQLGATQLTWAACPNSPVQVRTFGLQAAGFRWNQQNHALWGPVLDTKNPGSCNSGPESVGWDVTAGVRSRLGAHAIQLGLAPQDENALSRRHFSRAATLYVTYNSAPNVPTNPVFTSPSRQCGTAGSPAVLGQANVVVQVHQTDPDPGNVDTNFHLAKASNLGVKIQDKAGGFSDQGLKSVTFTGLTNGEVYAWRARGSDHRLDGVGFTAWCYFTVDTTKPAAPAVTAPGGATYVVGKGVSVSLTAAADVAGYVSWVTPTRRTSPSPAIPVDGTINVAAALPDCNIGAGSTVRWKCASGATPATMNVAPIDSLSTLWVSAYDRAGNQSAVVGLPLYPNGNDTTPAASANLDAGHAWQLSSMSSPLPDAIPDSNPWIGANGIDLLVPETSSRTSTDLPDPPLVSPVLSTAGGTAFEVSTVLPPVNATNSFSFSVWLKGGYSGTGSAQKIAIQGGGAAGSIQLQVTPEGTYAFCLGDNNVSSSSTNRASNCATGGKMTGQWQLVTGVWDAVNQQLRLHVGNSISPTAINGHILGAGDRSAHGPLVFGPAPMTGRWEGLFTNPVLVPGVIDHFQLARLAAFEIPFSD
ncbi:MULTISPECIES: LamG-like jellyroll fold domain-containing protein [unclassified Microbacterium]|uniref:LamG-like jellyroll fold domain-containing protein n=1 Tax=unclassified Microbacterium TaxID=2609290 RepID=UPI0034677BAF